MTRRYYSGREAERAHSIMDLRAMARRRLPAFVFEYMEGGAEDEVTLARNIQSFRQLSFLPSMLRDVSEVVLERKILGTPAKMPLIIAPMGYAGLFWPDGDLELALAASAAGIPFAQSIMSNADLLRVRDASKCRHWMQIYPFGMHVWENIIDKAERAGTEAIVLTVDGPVLGNREWDKRHYSRPFAPKPTTILEMLRHPSWMIGAFSGGLPTFPNIDHFVDAGRRTTAGTARWATTSLDPTITWNACKWLRDRWRGKLVVKGLLSPQDALQALDMGVDALVLSNHGGRQLDGVPSPMEVLPFVAEVIAGRAEIYLDSGVRRGSDVIKAIALGADAVMIGRAALYGLSAGGAKGVQRSIDILRSEMTRVLQLLGCPRLGEVDHKVLLHSTGALGNVGTPSRHIPTTLHALEPKNGGRSISMGGVPPHR